MIIPVLEYSATHVSLESEVCQVTSTLFNLCAVLSVKCLLLIQLCPLTVTKERFILFHSFEQSFRFARRIYVSKGCLFSIHNQIMHHLKSTLLTLTIQVHRNLNKSQFIIRKHSKQVHHEL